MKVPATDLNFGDEVSFGAYRATVRKSERIAGERWLIRFLTHEGESISDFVDGDTCYHVVARGVAA